MHNARLNAELLLAGVLGLKRLDLYLQFDRPLPPEELAEYKERLRRRARREPLQYIDGTAAFRDLVLRVDPRVLIPRPETEVLVQEVLDWARGRDNLFAVDVGTGSGAIALALATEGPFARVVATDAQAEALAAAKENHALRRAGRAVGVSPRRPAGAGARREPSTSWSPIRRTWATRKSARRWTPRCATGSRAPRCSPGWAGWTSSAGWCRRPRRR